MRSSSTVRRLVPASAATILVTLTLGLGSAAAAPSQAFANCDEAHAAGFSDIPRGDPRYSPHLDVNNDGIACANTAAGDAPPAEVPAAGTEVRGVTVEAAPDELAETGVTSWILAVLGLGLFSAGRRIVATTDRRRGRRASLRRARCSEAQSRSRSWTPTPAQLPELPPLSVPTDETENRS